MLNTLYQHVYVQNNLKMTTNHYHIPHIKIYYTIYSISTSYHTSSTTIYTMAPVKLDYKDSLTNQVYTLHYGRNAHENWELFDAAEPDDLWFHIDDLPSAHVYLEVSKEDPSDAAIEFAAKLVLTRTPKAGSVKGKKSITIINLGSPSSSRLIAKVVYCPRSNLAKGKSPGEILIHDPKRLSRVSIKLPPA